MCFKLVKFMTKKVFFYNFSKIPVVRYLRPYYFIVVLMFDEVKCCIKGLRLLEGLLLILFKCVGTKCP